MLWTSCNRTWVSTFVADTSKPPMVYDSNKIPKRSKTTPTVQISTTDMGTREASAPKWQTAALIVSMVVNVVMAIIMYGQYKVARETAERSERPYVLSESAFWRNGTSEAVVLIKSP